MDSPLIFPEVINGCNAYNAGNKLVGITGEFTLASFSAMTAAISGGGVLGEYNTAVTGMYQSAQQEIPFRIINEEFFDLMNTTKQAELVLRSSMQCVNRSSGGAVFARGMRIVYRGRPTAFNPGTLKQGELMNASVTLELTYVLIEMGGVVRFKLDKLNGICEINGVDVMADIRKQC